MSLNVIVLFGSKSCEHEISCISANQVLHALDPEKYHVMPVYISKNKEFYTGDLLFDLANYGDLDALCSKLEKVSLYKDGAKVYLAPVKRGLFNNKAEEVDVAFTVMHGANGEDGAISGYLEMLGLPYTCSNILASAIAQDKTVQKVLIDQAGIPTAPYFICYQYDYLEKEQEYLEKADKLEYPVILKPANLGSSIGISIAHDEAEFKKLIRESFQYDKKILVEHCLSDFKEINCSIMGTEYGGKASVLEEVHKDDEILSFKDKYEGNGSKGSKKSGPSKGMANTSRIIPARISEKLKEDIQGYSLKAYNLLGASGVIRIDYMVDKNDDIYLEEVNNIPGSLAFYLWEKDGINFSQLCDTLIKNAIAKYRDSEKKITSFDTNILEGYKK